MKQRKKFIAVIGNSNAGKSTVIISLTGCHSRSFRGFVTDRLSNESIYVIASSPQEQDLGSEEFRRILAQVIQNDNCRGLVMAIQPNKPRVRLSLEDMVREVRSRNAFELYLFILEPGRNDPDNDPDEVQGILNDVNHRLENSSLTAQGLDGRRFAFLNARHINQVSQMF